MPNVREVIESVRRHFVRSGDAYVAGRPAFSVAVDDHGLIKVTARRATIDPERSTLLTGEPLELRTASVGRGDRGLAPPAEITVDVDGRVRIDRGEVVEEVLNLPDGAEQRWVFERAPAGQGDVEIVVATAGLSYVGQDELGHHFIDETTGLGLCYGPATWVDGANRSSPVGVAFEDGSLRMVVAEGVVFKSAYPAVLDPVISPELGLVSTASGVAALAQTQPAVGFSPSGPSLVVWSDLRTGADFDIYGARVYSDMSVIDPVGFPINTDIGDQIQPDVGWDGSLYRVVWVDREPDGSTHAIQGTGVQLTTSSNPLEYQRLASPMDHLAISADGTLIVWTVGSSIDSRVYTAPFLQPGNASLLPTSLPPGTPTKAPEASCSPSNCYVVFEAGEYPAVEVRGVAVQTNGASTGMDQVIAGGGTPQREPTIGYLSLSDRYLVAWRQGLDGAGEIRGSRLDGTTHAIMDPGGFSIADAGSLAQHPEIGCRVDQCLVVWEDDRYGDPLPAPATRNELDLLGSQILEDGTVVHPDAFGVNVVAGDQVNPSVAAGFPNMLVAWEDHRDGVGDVYGTGVSLLAPFGVTDHHGVVIAQSGPRNQSPAVVYRHPHYIIVFADSRKSGDADYDIKAVRMHRRGFVTDPYGVPLVTALGHQIAPDIAYDNASDRLLVTWLDERTGSTEQRIRLLSGSLSPVGPETVVGPSIGPGFVEASSPGFLLAREVDGGSLGSDVGLNLIQPDGTISTTLQYDVDGNGADDEVSDVVTNGNEWMLVTGSSYLLPRKVAEGVSLRLFDGDRSVKPRLHLGGAMGLHVHDGQSAGASAARTSWMRPRSISRSLRRAARLRAAVAMRSMSRRWPPVASWSIDSASLEKISFFAPALFVR